MNDNSSFSSHKSTSSKDGEARSVVDLKIAYEANGIKMSFKNKTHPDRLLERFSSRKRCRNDIIL
jgi:hypothetical protein